MKKVRPIDAATEAALKAGKLLLRHYGKLKDSQIRMKTKNDFVISEVESEEKAAVERASRASRHIFIFSSSLCS